LALLASGVMAPARRFGALLVAGSFAWFAVEWNNPESGSAAVFTFGLVLYALAPAAVAHAAFAFPDGCVRDRLERGVLLIAYGDAAVLGLLSAFVFDPQANGCSGCPRNLFLVTDAGVAYRDLNRAGIWLGIVWGAAALMLIARRLMHITPVMLAAAAFLALVVADAVHARRRGFLSNDLVDRRLWLAEGIALFALALAVAWTWGRARRERAALARLVVELAASPGSGLRGLLAGLLGDPSLQLAYRTGDGNLVDARGRPAVLDGEVTRLVSGGEEIGLVSHRPGLLDDPARAREITAAARLAIEHERLQAEALEQLDALRASRARVIAIGDAERRRLEHDLHDGAQQRLVALSLALRLSLAQHGSDPAAEEAESELRAALADLRALAHGIFPAVLAEEGLTAAVEALAEERPLKVTALPADRLDPAVETAAYFVVSEAVRRSAGRRVTVGAARANGRLLVDVDGVVEGLDIVDLVDRVGALDGVVSYEHARIHAEIPCVS
jgi:signal transduction histidine kinase